VRKNQPPSGINFKSVPNFRDLGGIPAGGEKKIKNGIIFRSANPDTISKEDIKKLHSLNIRTIIDLRAPGERKKRKKSMDHIDVLSLPLDFQQTTRERLKPVLNKKNSEAMISDISNSLYLEILDATQPIFKEIMDVLCKPERCPVLIHCHVGKDRTGIISALILHALGTERQLIIDDYLKSNDALRPFFRKMLLKRKILSFGFFPSRTILYAITLRQRNIESVLDRIESHYGGIEAFLKDSGFDTSRLAELKMRLLVE
jgi:protein-tyrosine phosphatase